MYRLAIIIIVWCIAMTGRHDCQAQEMDTHVNKIGEIGLDEIQQPPSGEEQAMKGRVEALDYDLKVMQQRSLLRFNDFSSKRKANDLGLNLTSGVGPLLNWHRGMVTADRESVSYPGMMGKEFAAFNVYQNVGRFIFGAHVDALRYGYTGGVSNQFGAGGMIGYRVSDNVSIVVFGSVYSQAKGRGINPAMMGFMPSSSYGGFVNLQFGYVGLMAGVRSEYVPLHGRWEMRPVIAPYIGNGSQKISVDVGSIIGDILSHALGPDSDVRKPGLSNKSLPSVGRPGYIPPHRR